MWIFKDANFDIMGKRYLGFVVSGVLLTVALASLVMHGGPKYGIDFSGGTLLELRFSDANDPSIQKSVNISDVRAAFDRLGFPDAEIKTFGTEADVSVNLSVESADPETIKDIHTKVAGEMDGYSVEKKATGECWSQNWKRAGW